MILFVFFLDVLDINELIAVMNGNECINNIGEQNCSYKKNTCITIFPVFLFHL